MLKLLKFNIYIYVHPSIKRLIMQMIVQILFILIKLYNLINIIQSIILRSSIRIILYIIN